MAKVSVSLNEDVYKKLKKRADKELMTVPELVSSILRKSVVAYGRKKSSRTVPVEEKFIERFSRKR